MESGGSKLKNLLASVLLLGLATSAFAGITVAPEIDASTASGALTLISGAALVLRARRRK
jgi:hypothetical protein